MTDREGLAYGLCCLTIISALETILSGGLRVSFCTPALLPAPAHLRAGKYERTLYRASRGLSVSYCTVGLQWMPHTCSLTQHCQIMLGWVHFFLVCFPLSLCNSKKLVCIWEGRAGEACVLCCVCGGSRGSAECLLHCSGTPLSCAFPFCSRGVNSLYSPALPRLHSVLATLVGVQGVLMDCSSAPAFQWCIHTHAPHLDRDN